MFASDIPVFWLVVGFGGQLLFTARMVVQWIASERRRESIVPISFWYLSLSGGWMLLIYAIYRRDPVIIFGQVLGVVVYSRNLILIHRRRWHQTAASAASPSASPPGAGEVVRALVTSTERRAA